jgi:hypothetical protein
MIMITITLIFNVIDYECDYILSNHDYNHEYNAYHANINVILHLYSLSYMYNTDIATKKKQWTFLH